MRKGICFELPSRPFQMNHSDGEPWSEIELFEWVPIVMMAAQSARKSKK
jgi:hypothetical protein